MSRASTPSVPSDIGPTLRQFLLWVRNKLNGGGMERSVTFADLVSMGVVNVDIAKRQSEK